MTKKTLKLHLSILILAQIVMSSCYRSTFYLVRHAERLDQSEDTPLSEAGKKRGEDLALLLKDKKIDSVFVSKYQRTLQTAQPLLNELNQKAGVYETKPVTIVANRLKKLKGKNALMVGHNNNVIETARALGAKPTLKSIEHTDYDNLLIVNIKRRLFWEKVSLVETTYGQKTLP